MSDRAVESRWGRWAFLAAALGLLALGRVHQGLRHDARLYFGDALARLDPQGVGRDLIFAHDGQFGFSLYTPVLAKLVGCLGLDAAVRLVTATGLVAWLLALMLLASKLLADLPIAWRRVAVVLVLAVAPYYGAFEVFGFGEAVATPRILVEALGMTALAAWLMDRRWLAFGLLVAGLALHPIMALCGLAVLFAVLCLEDRRWLIAAGAGLAALLAGALMGLPVVERLLQVMDPAWRAFSQDRGPAVFTSHWPTEAWGRLSLQVATLGIAAALLEGRARRLMLAALVAGLLGVGAALAADVFSLVLPLQLQTWRTEALMAVLAALGLAVCLRSLPARGPSGAMAACALAVGWTYAGWGPPALVASLVAVLAYSTGDRVWSRSREAVRIAVGLTILLVAIWAVLRLQGTLAGLAGLPAEKGLILGLVWNSGLPGWIAAATALVLAARPELLSPRPALIGGVILALAGLTLWDGRTAHARWRDSGRDAALVAMIADRPGEVLWLGGDVEPWTLAGRPIWASRMQGAGAALSRPLATTLSARIDRLIALGLADANWRRPQSAAPKPRPVPTTVQVRGLCASPDAPAWLIAPLAQGETVDPALNARAFAPPAVYPVELGGRWEGIAAYAVIPCAGPSRVLAP